MSKARILYNRTFAACALATVALGCAPDAKSPAGSQTATASPAPKAKTAVDPLQRGNGDFHVEYAAGRAREQATLGDTRPYLFLGEGKLTLRYRGKTDERSLSSDRFDAVKDASHVAIAAVSAILAKRDANALSELAQRIREIDPVVTAARFGASEAAAHAVVRASVDLLQGAMTTMPSDADLHAFGLRTRADTTTLLQAGCDDLLVTLDAAIRQLRPLAGDAWSQAVMVIETDHQSRGEEVGTQYFEHLFNERAKEGALGESRIVIVEHIGPNDSPLQAMASHLYDQHLSVLLFDDPAFLQGDVLGKHAAPTITRLLGTAL